MYISLVCVPYVCTYIHTYIHTFRLLLYGMICCLGERYSEAEEFFEMATTMDATNVIAWTMRGTCTIGYLAAIFIFTH